MLALHRAAAPHLLGGDDVVLEPHHVGDAGHAPVPGAQARKLHHEVDAARDLAPQGGEGDVSAPRHQHVLEADERVARVVRVQGAHRAGVAGVHRLEHLVRLGAPHLADDDAVGAHAQGIDEEVAHRHLPGSFRADRPGLEADDVGLLELELRRVLDGDEALAVRDLPRQGVHERGLAGAGAAGNEDVEPRLHRDAEELAHRGRQHLALRHLVESGPLHDEAPNRDRRPV